MARYIRFMQRKRVAVVGCAILTGAALAGCSSGNDGIKPTSTATSASATSVDIPVKVVVDGQTRPVRNTVACVSANDMVFVNIGTESDGIAATLTDGDQPAVKHLTLGTYNGLTLVFTAGESGAASTVTKSGRNYQITGTASGNDGTNPVRKHFELDFTCPPS